MRSLSLLSLSLLPLALAQTDQFDYTGCYTDSQTRRLQQFSLTSVTASSRALSESLSESDSDSLSESDSGSLSEAAFHAETAIDGRNLAATQLLTTDLLNQCKSDCVAKGFPYVSLQNGRICYCAYKPPDTALLTDTECASVSCDSQDLLTTRDGCGSVFINALYQVADDDTSCYNHVKDPNEEGVDCGGSCITQCDLVQDGSFENIAILAEGASKDLTGEELAEKSSWTGEGGTLAASGASIGNGQNAPMGDYYLGIFGQTYLNQSLPNDTHTGDTYRLSWYASATTTDAATITVIQDGVPIASEHLFDRFAMYFVEIEVFETSMELSFLCTTDDPHAACLIDAVNFTSIYQCSNTDGQTLAVYSDNLFSDCSDVMSFLSSNNNAKCNEDINDLFDSPINALAVPDEYCCTSCATTQRISSDVPPDEEFPLCAKEGDDCECTGTIYFGEPGGEDWSEVISDGLAIACTTENFGDTTVGGDASIANCYCGGYSFTGCFDDPKVRTLQTYVLGNENGLTSANVDACISACRNSGAPYVALQNAQMCYCTYGYPESARLDDDQCSTRCGETDVVIWTCGGQYASSLFAIAADTSSCSNGIQDGGEQGVDCGGRCSDACNLVDSGSFETITTTANSKLVSSTTLGSASKWSGSGYIVHSGATFGGSQTAPDGTYFFALPGLGSLSQLLNNTYPGDMLLLTFYASYHGTVTEAPTIQIRTGSPAIVDEITLSETFTQFSIDFSIFVHTVNLQLLCNADSSVNCLLDAVVVTRTRACNDLVDEALMLYSSETEPTCISAVRDLQGSGFTCADDTADLFHTDALANGENFCCSSCAFLEGNAAVEMPDDIYKLCSWEDHTCLCDGTVYFGKSGWGDWATELSDGTGISCATDVFGDPAEGMSKACYCDGKVSYAPAAGDYVGCFSTAAEEDFEHFLGDFHNMTLSVCMTMCMQRGQPFFAVSFGAQCYCSGGYPTSISASSSSLCSEPCAGDSSQICGGEFYLSVYQVGPELGTCSDGIRDGSEEGVDCGGDCPVSCNLLLDGSFEDLTTTTSDALMYSPGAWIGEVKIEYNRGGDISKKAIDGNYFAALVGPYGLNQTVTGICDGDILALTYWAAKTTVNGKSSQTLQVISDDVLWAPETTDLTTAWNRFTLRLIVDQKGKTCCGDDCSLTIGFKQDSTTYGALLDGVTLTVQDECENLSDEELQQDLDMLCPDLLTEMKRKQATCDTPLRSYITALDNAGNTSAWDICCSACWDQETSHVDEAANNQYTFCSNEDTYCTCDGIIYFGIDNTYAWAEYDNTGSGRPVMCSTANFVDPNPNGDRTVVRKCYCDGSITTTSTTTTTRTARTTTKRHTTTRRHTTTQPHIRTTTSADTPAGSQTTPGGAATDDGVGIAVGVVITIIAVGAAVGVGIYVYRRMNPSKGTLTNKYATTHNLLSSSSLEVEMSAPSSTWAENSAPFVSNSKEYEQPSLPSAGPAAAAAGGEAAGSSSQTKKKKPKRKKSKKARTSNQDSLL